MQDTALFDTGKIYDVVIVEEVRAGDSVLELPHSAVEEILIERMVRMN